MIENPQIGSLYYILEGSELLCVEIVRCNGNVYLASSITGTAIFILEKSELFETIDDALDYCNRLIELRDTYKKTHHD